MTKQVPFFTEDDFEAADVMTDCLVHIDDAVEKANAKILEWYSREHAPLQERLAAAEEALLSLRKELGDEP